MGIHNKVETEIMYCVTFSQSQRDFGDGVLGQTNIFVDIYYAQSGLDVSQ